MEEFKDIVFGDASENFSTHEAHIIRAIYEHELSDNLNGRFSVSHSSHDKLYQNLYVTDTWKAGGVTYNGYDPITNTVALDGYKDTTQRDTSILSYDISGEFKTGGFVHNFILGFQYLDMSNNNDRYNAAFVTDNNNDGDTEIFAIERRLDIAGGTGFQQLLAPLTLVQVVPQPTTMKVRIEVLLTGHLLMLRCHLFILTIPSQLRTLSIWF